MSSSDGAAVATQPDPVSESESGGESSVRGIAGVPGTMQETFEADPVSGKPILLKDGRFGPYVTDGEINATVPRGMSLDDLDFEAAVQLIADKRAKGPAPKRTAKKKAPAKKKPAAKKFFNCWNKAQSPLILNGSKHVTKK